jgi:inosine-uridine nucleoside N-ribohydrolase
MTSTPATSTTPTRVILDCDPGNGVPATDIDDGIALGLLLADPGIQLDAVTIVTGNTHRDVGYDVARSMLDHLGVDAPVYAGASEALQEPSGPWTERREGHRISDLATELWADVPSPDHYDHHNDFSAAAHIAKAVADAPGEITLVAIGPLTNIAHAIQLNPTLPEQVRELVIMGGAFDVPGFLQELNFAVDPEAARFVLASGTPITLVPLDVTITTTLLDRDLEPLRASEKSLPRYLARTVAPWIAYCESDRREQGCRLHDPLAVSFLLDRSIVTTERASVDVQLDDVVRSRPVRWNRDDIRLATGIDLPATPEIDIVTSVDNGRLVELIQRVVLSA